MNLKEQQYVCTLARCRNLSRAAEALFIHRNSLQYRLSKIEDLLGLELDDYMEYLDLVNCILVKRLMFT